LASFTPLKKYLTTYLKRELSDKLFYHGFHHTVDVYNYVIEIARAEKINRADLTLLKVAVLLHDAGFTKKYAGHEEVSCDMARDILPRYHYSRQEISMVCDLIMATKIPQQPKTHLERILADADLMYLGTKRFVEVGYTLFEEMKIYSGVLTETQWNRIQLDFMKKHHYHTDYCRKKYEQPKQKNLTKILDIIKKYK
jgi:uncharacterized protein